MRHIIKKKRSQLRFHGTETHITSISLLFLSHFCVFCFSPFRCMFLPSEISKFSYAHSVGYVSMFASRVHSIIKRATTTQERTLNICKPRLLALITRCCHSIHCAATNFVNKSIFKNSRAGPLSLFLFRLCLKQ